MIKEIVVRHHEYISTKPFEDVVAAFEAAVGTLEDIGWDSIPASSKDAAQFEAKVKERIGSSGFTRFLTIDHGRWLTMMGQPTKMRMYTIGNPLIAITMLRHELRLASTFRCVSPFIGTRKPVRQSSPLISRRR